MSQSKVNLDNNKEFVNCNLCGSSEFSFVCSFGEVKIVKCRNCELICRNPRLKENLNREFYSYDYYGDYAGIEERISAARINLFENTLLKLEKKRQARSNKLLDVGCGQGNFLKLARDYGWRVNGVELARSACEYGKVNFNLDILNTGIEEAHFKENSFDVITLWNVLDHLRNPLEMLKEAYRILEPDGILIIRVPNVTFHILVHRIFPLINKFCKSLNDPSIIVNYGFSVKTIKKILHEAGFCNIKIENSLLTKGDPYKSFSFSENVVGALKVLLNFIASLVYFISFSRICTSSSLLVFARK
jgi:2-polyprenyl-3-methyl-5-hydroxy-6-metoxy-1,4-benzoquinol methylase